jgi:type I restriction enzyme S subunit
MNQQDFKQTEVGRIPKEWEVVRLGKVLSLKNGERPLTSENGISPIYGANGIIGYTSNFLMDNDFTVIIGRVGASGEVHLGMRKIWISDNAIYSENYDKNRVYIPFVYYLLKFKKLSQFASKSTHPIITQSFLNLFLIPLPPLPEQKKIAEILSTVDEAIGGVDKVLAKTGRVKKGLMQELLTKGIGHKHFKQTKIGRIPKDWEIVRLGEVCTKRNEIILPTGEGQVRFIGLEHIESGKTKVKYFSTDSGIKSSKFKFYARDILYGKLRPYLDKAIVAEFEGICSTDLIVLTPDKNKYIRDFLIYIIHSDKFISHAISNTSGTNYPRTSWKAISRFNVVRPLLPEQKKIAEILSTVDKRIQLLREKKRKLKKVKKGLMNDLLTGKRRVKSNL